MKQKYKVWWEWKDWNRTARPILVEDEIDMSDTWSDYIKGETIELDLGDPPTEKDFIAPRAAAIRQEIGKHAAKITKLEEQLQSLLCLEYKPEESPVAPAIPEETPDDDIPF